MISQTFGKLLFGIYSIIGHYGWSIVVFTILVKVLLLPLALKQSQAMKRMNELQPKLKEIQEKYKNDREKLNQKQMELYKEHNANPLGSCLPLLIQLPIMFALFGVLREPATYVFTAETGVVYEAISKSFLWIKDLALPDVMNAEVLNEAGEVVRVVNGFYILPILSGLTTYIQTKMTTPQTGATTSPGQNNFTTYFFPIMLGWMSLRFSAGLALYWVLGNIFTIVQQYITTGGLSKSREGSR